MSTLSLSEQVAELRNNVGSGIHLALKITTGTGKLILNTTLFLISCGSLQRWNRRGRVPRHNQGDLSGSSQTEEQAESSYFIKDEMNPSIIPTKSREFLRSLVKDHEFARRESWVRENRNQEDMIIIPSYSLDQEELGKVSGVSTYEERQLCTLFYLRNPSARMVYATSVPVDNATVNYYLKLLEENSMVKAEDASQRLLMVNCNDNSIKPLSAKILRKPKMIERIKKFINNKIAHMTCFISSNLERELAVQLEVPLFSNDPALSYWGTKIGSRIAFEKAQVLLPLGTPLVKTMDELAESIANLYLESECKIARFVVKLNIGFAGEGNAILRTNNFNPDELVESVKKAMLNDLEYVSSEVNWDYFYKKILMYGALAEVWVENVISSPSCQALINPRGEIELLSTHEQLLEDGMCFLGCIFPCEEEYRKILMENTRKIGEVLASKGCRERFAVDYVITRSESGEVQAHAIEINLRWGGTSHPMITAKYLTHSELTEEGLLKAADENYKYYVATDNVKDEVFTGLNPEDFLEIVNEKPELQFNKDTTTGVVFHLLAAISVFGKFGFVAIENSPEGALQLYQRTIDILKEKAASIDSEKNPAQLDLTISTPEN